MKCVCSNACLLERVSFELFAQWNSYSLFATKVFQQIFYRLRGESSNTTYPRMIRLETSSGMKNKFFQDRKRRLKNCSQPGKAIPIETFSFLVFLFQLHFLFWCFTGKKLKQPKNVKLQILFMFSWLVYFDAQ